MELRSPTLPPIPPVSAPIRYQENTRLWAYSLDDVYLQGNIPLHKVLEIGISKKHEEDSIY